MARSSPPKKSPRATRYSDFAGFIDVFKWVTSFLRDPEDYALITRRLLEELLRQNVVYAEITISAGVMLRRMQNVEANFAAIRETSQIVSFSRLRTAWIFDAARQFGADAAKEVARWACEAAYLRRRRLRHGRRRTFLSQPSIFAPPSIWRATKACTSFATRAKSAARNPCAKPLKFSAPSASDTASP